MKVVVAFLINTLFNFAIGLLVARFLGPAQFGRFALTLAIGLVLQTALFDWIRLTSVRFYSERARASRPELRATLDVTFALIALAVTGLTLSFMLSGIRLPISNALIGLAATCSITNGLFDYSTALVRARFHDGLYTKLIITKNVLALALTTGGAYLFASANMALVGVVISMGGAVLVARRSLSDEGAHPSRASRKLAWECLRYSAPIVAANALYLGIPLINRSLVTARFGFAETGQFSLAFDIGTRVVAAIGTALDVLLFQIAVRADELHGPDHAREQVARNMAVVLLVLAPCCIGLWLVLPSVQMIVPKEFRGPFGHYMTLLLPGLFCYGMMAYAINPIFQIRKSTSPMIAAAVAACLMDAVLGFVLPRGADASSLAIAQAASLVTALAALIVFSFGSRPKWPPARDFAAIFIASAAMAVAVLPLRGMAPGAIALGAESSLGALVYGAIAFAFDAAGARTLFFTLKARRRGGTVSAASAASRAPEPPDDEISLPDRLAG